MRKAKDKYDHDVEMFQRAQRRAARRGTVGLPPTKYHPWPHYPHAQTRERARRLRQGY